MKKNIKLNENKLRDKIVNIVNETSSNNQGTALSEVVIYNSVNDSFSFDFETDGKKDIIEFSKVVYTITVFGHCFYYAYEFTGNVSSQERTAFIHSLKFPDGKISVNDKNKFIVNVINRLDKEISLPSYDVVVYPEFLSELNHEMLSYINRIAQPQVVNMELIKSLPSKIEFDYDRFDIEVLQSKLKNSQPKYSDKQKAVILNNIRVMMENIHNLEYFSIARDVKKTKYRQFIKNYYQFKNENDKRLYETIMRSNILIIDDVSISGTTISFILKCLRSVNDNNKIVIFSLNDYPNGAPQDK